MTSGRPLPATATRGSLERALAERLGSRTEARWLVEEVLGAGPSGSPVDDDRQSRLWALADRRVAGEPLQYVLGSWSFRSMEVLVDPRALIPRPETEQVVEVALEELRRLGHSRPLSDPLGTETSTQLVVDLGTGTGVIALSLALESGARVWATDLDPDALALASENRTRLGEPHPGLPERVILAAGPWYRALPDELRGRIDLIVSNPPYVAQAEWTDLDAEVRREPYRALVATAASDGTPGLADVEAVLLGAVDWLRRPGAVVVELAPHQAAAAVGLARRIGFADVRVDRDLAGRDRTLVGRV